MTTDGIWPLQRRKILVLHPLEPEIWTKKEKKSLLFLLFAQRTKVRSPIFHIKYIFAPICVRILCHRRKRRLRERGKKERKQCGIYHTRSSRLLILIAGCPTSSTVSLWVAALLDRSVQCTSIYSRMHLCPLHNLQDRGFVPDVPKTNPSLRSPL